MATPSPEYRFLSPSAERLPEAEEALYGVLVPKYKEEAIRPEDFKGLNNARYSDEAIARDMAFVHDRQTKFRSGEAPEANKKFGELFEAIIKYQIEQNDMMGPGAEAVVPSPFDDIANGIDAVVQLKKKEGEEGTDESHLALAIDVTGSELKIDEKFGKIQENVRRGLLSEVKYFRTEDYRGPLNPVARVVIGADHAITSDISDLILRFERLKKPLADARKSGTTSALTEKFSADFRDVREKLAEHPLHTMVLMEIQAQLEAQKKYAEKKGQTVAAQKLDETLRAINAIIAEKKNFAEQAEDPDFIGNTDSIYRMIMDRAHDLGTAE